LIPPSGCAALPQGGRIKEFLLDAREKKPKTVFPLGFFLYPPPVLWTYSPGGGGDFFNPPVFDGTPPSVSVFAEPRLGWGRIPPSGCAALPQGGESADWAENKILPQRGEGTACGVGGKSVVPVVW